MQNHKNKFPIFKNNPTLVYLDSAATTQKPRSVIKSEIDFYSNYNANVHRGVYGIAVRASEAYENVRVKVAEFIGAARKEEIVFTSGTTASINLVAQSFLSPRLNEGDEVIISAMEHHANLIPWQQACLQKKAVLRVIPFDENGVLDLQFYENSLNEKTKFVAVTHISNTLGTINPIEKIIEAAHKKDIPVLVDAAQSISGIRYQVSATDNRQPTTDNQQPDFLVFSAHKLFGPTGVGILFGKAKHLEAMQPYQFGGDMIRDVSFERTLFAPPPQRFEPGTQNIAGVIGLGAAIDFVKKIGQKNIYTYTHKLLEIVTEKLQAVSGVRIIGNAPEKSGIISFIVGDIHPHDVASILAQRNICIRAGQHCTQPIMDFFDLPGTIRASFSIYNTEEDIDKLIAGIEEVKKVMQLK